MKDSEYFNISYRYGKDNKIEYMRTKSPLIPHDYTYVYRSNVFPRYFTNWYKSHITSSNIDWIYDKEYIPVPEHEVPEDIRAMNILLIGE